MDVSSLADAFAQENHTLNKGTTLVLLSLVFIKMFIFYPPLYVEVIQINKNHY